MHLVGFYCEEPAEVAEELQLQEGEGFEDDVPSHDEPLAEKQLGEPAWRNNGIEVGQLVVLDGGGSTSWWVGEVHQLLDVVWDPNLDKSDPNQPTHDMVVYEYEGSGEGATFKRDYADTATGERIKCEVWFESCRTWGWVSEILTGTGKLRAAVRKTLADR